MSLVNFDGSELFAFVASPLFARNESPIDTDAVIRSYAHGGSVWSHEDMPSKAESAVFPDSLPYDGFSIPSASPANYGNTFKTIQFPAGWFRLRLLAWGIAPRCRPWVVPRNEDIRVRYISPTNPGVIITAYESAFEMSLIWSKIAPATDNIQFVVPMSPTRIQLNATDPSDDSSPALPFQLYHMVRFIDVSCFSEEAGSAELFSNWSIQSSRFDNFVFVVPNSSGYTNSEWSWVHLNRNRFNPSNPVTVNGQSLGLYSGGIEFYSRGSAMCCIPISITSDTIRRDPVYTDITMDLLDA